MNRWVFDLGNSRLKCAALNDDGSLGVVHALGHDGVDFEAELSSLLPQGASSACLASVASPVVTQAVLDLLAARFQRISIARSAAHFAGVHIAYAEPARMGVDRFLALLAAHARAPGAWLVVGVGTALTLDLLDDSGQHRGGRIAPSPRLMREALHQAAVQLPEDGGDYVEFATDTHDALVSGCDGAALGLIERSLREATQVLGETPGLLLHGGGAEALVPHLPHAVLVPTLVLEGLAQWSRAGTATP